MNIRRFDSAVIDFMRKHSLPILRVSLGLVFLWFGVLKVIGRSPVESLVAETLSFLPFDVAVIGTGLLEIVIAIGLLTGYAIRLTLLMFFVQMLGTFSALVLHRDRAFFDNNPVMLTEFGEFVVKNIVFVAAGMAIVGGTAKAGSKSIPEMIRSRV